MKGKSCVVVITACLAGIGNNRVLEVPNPTIQPHSMCLAGAGTIVSNIAEQAKVDMIEGSLSSQIVRLD